VYNLEFQAHFFSAAILQRFSGKDGGWQWLFALT
jgi:hypothetical protein